VGLVVAAQVIVASLLKSVLTSSSQNSEPAA
jgi:hypothetical protein